MAKVRRSPLFFVSSSRSPTLQPFLFSFHPPPIAASIQEMGLARGNPRFFLALKRFILFLLPLISQRPPPIVSVVDAKEISLRHVFLLFPRMNCPFTFSFSRGCLRFAGHTFTPRKFFQPLLIFAAFPFFQAFFFDTSSGCLRP